MPQLIKLQRLKIDQINNHNKNSIVYIKYVLKSLTKAKVY
jgi:hypothetical protein